MNTIQGLVVQSNNFSAQRSGIATAVACALVWGSATAWAGPAGEQVSAGQATVSRSGSNTLINQSTDRAAINWQNFNIGAAESVRFAQPSAASVTLNRVLSGRRSTEIFGSLSANGQIFIVNQSGVVFGKSAQVNVGGLVASGLALSDTDFMAGNYKFINDLPPNQSGGAVVNSGNIVANGGYVALLGSQIRNDGTIIANGGKVVLAGGNEITVRVYGSKLIDLTVDQGWFNSSVENADGGLIKADGGQVLLTAAGVDRVIKSVVNNGGSVEANTVSNVGGTIVLGYENQVVTPGVKGSVVNSGIIEANTVGDVVGVIRLDGGTVGNSNFGVLRADGAANASGTVFGLNGNYVGQGGNIEIRGDFVALAGNVSADGARGGAIDVKAFGAGGLNITAENVSARGLSLNGGSITYLTMPRTGGKIYDVGWGRHDVSGATDGGRISVFGDGGVFTSGRYYARGETGYGGMINIAGPNVGLFSAQLDASGAKGGGGVGVGSFIDPAWRGGVQFFDFSWTDLLGWRDPTHVSFGCVGCTTPGFYNNQFTLIDDASRINVSSSQGKGGYAAIWAGQENTMLGGIDARGATGGGTISISSADTVRINDLANVYAGAGGLLNITAERVVIGDPAAASDWIARFRRETAGPVLVFDCGVRCIDYVGSNDVAVESDNTVIATPLTIPSAGVPFVDNAVASGSTAATQSPTESRAGVTDAVTVTQSQSQRAFANTVNREVARLAGATAGAPVNTSITSNTPVASGLLTVLDGGLNVPLDAQ